MNLNEATTEAFRLSALLDSSLDFLKEQVREFADAEEAYRMMKAQAWITAPKGTVPEREAHVNGETAKARHRRDVAEGMKQAALEAVRSRRAQISSLQTLLNAYQEEARFGRTGPVAA